MKKDLELVNQYQKEIILLDQVISLLDWDKRTFMPKQGINSRSEQFAYLTKLSHEKITSPKLFEAVKKLKRTKLNEHDKIMIIKLDKKIEKSRKLPKKFVEELAKTIALSSQVWKKAKETNDPKLFIPHLQKIVELKRKQAGYISLPGHIYNSLLDEFEEGMTLERLNPLFKKLKKELIILLKKIENSREYKNQKIILLKKQFPAEKQIQFCREIMQRIGLSPENSRIDLYEHPFSTKIGTNDIRITTKIRQYPQFAFLSSIHESGHALYMLNMPKQDKYNFLGDAPTYSMHESQSRFWENIIALNKPFWKYYFLRFARELGLSNFNQWYHEINRVFPGKIRIESDEIHYCLHIILRLEIEVALIEGSINAKDVPRIWNEKMEEVFGVKIKNDREGFLQDNHWSNGSFGYFPSYAIGTIYASQLYKTLIKQHPEIEKQIEQGNYETIKKWLKENIHKYGAKISSDKLIKKITGQGLNSDFYLDYLNKKYSEIYKE